MAECSFCGKKYSPGTGLTVFRRDGSSVHYCSRKCVRNAQLKRNPRKVKWTKQSEAA